MIKSKLRLWRDALLTWILKINAWLNQASIFVLVAIGLWLGLVVIMIMIRVGITA